jgi:hypothetical protein
VHTSGVAVVLVLLGIFIAALRAIVLWSGTAGVEWTSTHGRNLRPAARVSDRQQAINTVLARTLGPMCMLAGIAVLVIGLTR